jgi:hypothetical protein
MLDREIGSELPLSSEKAVVAIKSISRWEFNWFLPEHSFVESMLGEQVAWWADEGGCIIGTITKNVRKPAWSFIVLKRDTDGQLRACNLRTRIRSRLAASTQLLRLMETIQQSGRRVLASGRMT